MAVKHRLAYLFIVSCILWLGAMGSLYYMHYVRHTKEEELGYFSADVKFDNERRQYFGIYLDGKKIGYKSESQFNQKGLKVLREDGTLKLNLAGMSREVFIQTTAGIDSASLITRYMDFTLSSGEHVDNFSAIVKQDSLIILVKNNQLAEWRKGAFIVDEHITMPSTLPFYLHNSTTDIMSMQIFDPVTFSLSIVNARRIGKEELRIGDRSYETVRYDLRFETMNSHMWLDSHGAVVKSEGFPFFGNVLGSFVTEKAMDKNVFLLPLEVPYGNEALKKLALAPDTAIQSPREVFYLEVELTGMRAANIDITGSNKEIRSLNPVVFALHNRPVAEGKRAVDEMKAVAADTSLAGMSDYIQPYDSRILRTAKSITSAGSAEHDTLAMAHALNQWIFARLDKVQGLDITRSIDILRNLKGDCDEHTKLFTALSRSLGIPTQINLGLVYRDNVFRYQSWPSIFVDGVWYDLDPLFGQDYADATHIALIRGDFDKLVELFRLMNFISVKVLAYR